eukprot:TRINITY_DN629_c0_g4_i1.p1 TRINITY_DN629_c0_g4~~TRINITY_DN629_c0_g4_i1.p1  ORF type:complete len:112 (-),score=46.58 TRINITY_DN629_c0_g4_i1:91-426(-)
MSQQQLEQELATLRSLQKDTAKSMQMRRKYALQLNENETVLKELELLDEDANVYKLIGPALVKQDLMEAKTNVEKRIGYISNEMKRLEEVLKDMEAKQEAKQKEIMDLQKR